MEDSQGIVGVQDNNESANEGATHPMDELLEGSFQYRELHHGDVVEGTIVHVSAAEVLIDIGSKSEGVLAGREMERMGPEAASEIQVGQKVLVYVLNPEDKNGNVVLSLSHAQLERDWREAERRFQAGEIFSCVASSYNKGGLIAHIGKVRGFIPASQLVVMPRGVDDDEKRAEELTKLVGQEFQLKIIEVDRERNRLILSQRAAARETRQEQREKLLANLVEGTSVRGRVSNLCDFGAFVNLGGADGLIHISELSWGRVSHPSEILAVGDEIAVRIIRIDPDRKRIGLSLKETEEQTELDWQVDDEDAETDWEEDPFAAITDEPAAIVDEVELTPDESESVVDEPVAVVDEIEVIAEEPEPAVDETIAVVDEVEGISDEPKPGSDEAVAAMEDVEAIADEPDLVSDDFFFTDGFIAVVDEAEAIADEPEPVADEPVAVVDEAEIVIADPEPIADEPIAGVDEAEVVIADPEPVADELAAVVDEAEAVIDEAEPVADELGAVVDEAEAVIDEAEPVADELAAVVDEVEAVIDEPDAVADEPIAVVDEVEVIPDEPEPAAEDQATETSDED